MPGFTQIPNEYVFDDPLWTSEKMTKGQAYADLFRLAQFKPWMVNKRGNLIDLKPGQIGWSMVELSKRWKRSMNWVRGLLNYLEKAHHIVQQKTNVSTTITLLHWRDYGTTERTANGSQIEQQTDSRRYPNNIVNREKIDNRGKSSRKNYSLSQEVLNKLQEKYTKVEVSESYDQFNKYNKSKGNKLVDVEAGFENWLKRDEEWEKNPRIKQSRIKTFFCENEERKCFGLSKSVKNSEDIFYPTCDNCNHNMIPEYEYKHILARIKQESIANDNDKRQPD